MRSLALDPATLLRRDPALIGVLWLWTTPTSVVGSGADMCPMALHGSWVVKEGLAATACSKAHMFPRHAHALPRCLVDVWADDVIMTYKLCGQTSQHHTIVHHHDDNRSQAWHYSASPCS
jgi:hypothetical protein